MSLMEISKSIPQNLDYSERNQILPKNDTQKSGNSQKMIPKNPGIAQKGTQKSGSNPKKVPKIMAHPHITTYASYPPPPEVTTYKMLSKINIILPLWKIFIMLRASQMNKVSWVKS